jgi:hypothetical protein
MRDLLGALARARWEPSAPETSSLTIPRTPSSSQSGEGRDACRGDALRTTSRDLGPRIAKAAARRSGAAARASRGSARRPDPLVRATSRAYARGSVAAGRGGGSPRPRGRRQRSRRRRIGCTWARTRTGPRRRAEIHHDAGLDERLADAPALDVPKRDVASALGARPRRTSGRATRGSRPLR